jgi:uncharacterized protein (DUF2141 family)
MEFIMRTLTHISRVRFAKTLIAGLSIALFAVQAHSAKLTVTLTEIAKPTGKMGVKLVNSAEQYGGEGNVQAQNVDVSSTDSIVLSFDNLAPGQYAVMVMHDENSNGKLDANLIGIPKEGYGFSNNPRVMRQPTYDETKFEVKAEDVNITIEIL